MPQEDWEMRLNEFYVTFYSRRVSVRKLIKKKMSIIPMYTINLIREFEKNFNEQEYCFDDKRDPSRNSDADDNEIEPSEGFTLKSSMRNEGL
jgi:hypothetical protein